VILLVGTRTATGLSPLLGKINGDKHP